MNVLPFLLEPNNKQIQLRGDERTIMWYAHAIGFPKLTAIWSHGFKLLWNDYEGRQAKKLPPTFRLFDMVNDPYEDNNLIPLLLHSCVSQADKIVPLDWEEVANINHRSNSIDEKKVVALLIYLQYKMHFFRHEGN